MAFAPKLYCSGLAWVRVIEEHKCLLQISSALDSQMAEATEGGLDTHGFKLLSALSSQICGFVKAPILTLEYYSRSTLLSNESIFHDT